MQVAVLAAALATVAAPWSALRSKMVSVMALVTESGSGSNLESGSGVATVSAMVLAPGSVMGPAMVSGSAQVMASTTTPEVRGWARSQARRLAVVPATRLVAGFMVELVFGNRGRVDGEVHSCIQS